MNNRVKSIIFSLCISALLAYLTLFTSTLNDTIVQKLYIWPGLLLAPVFAVFYYLASLVGFSLPDGPGIGFLLFPLGGFIIWWVLLYYLFLKVFNKIANH